MLLYGCECLRVRAHVCLRVCGGGGGGGQKVREGENWLAEFWI